jgi:hypothetical protein
MYRMQAINRRPGYHRVYGETTKYATEASVFSARPLNDWMEWRGLWPDLVGLDVPHWKIRPAYLRMDYSIYSILPSHQG